MSIALDTTSHGTGTGGTGTLSHTMGSVSNGFLFVIVNMSTYTSNTSDPEVASITYNGVGMTLLKHIEYAFQGAVSDIYGMYNPPSGAHNIVVTTNDGYGFNIIGVSYSGVAQTTTMDKTGGGTDYSATSITTTLTTVADNCWTIAAATLATTAGSGSTQRGAAGCYDSNGVIHPAGSYSMTVNLNGDITGDTMAMVSFAPYVAPVTSGDFLNLML